MKRFLYYRMILLLVFLESFAFAGLPTLNTITKPTYTMTQSGVYLVGNCLIGGNSSAVTIYGNGNSLNNAKLIGDIGDYQDTFSSSALIESGICYFKVPASMQDYITLLKQIRKDNYYPGSLYCSGGTDFILHGETFEFHPTHSMRAVGLAGQPPTYGYTATQLQEINRQFQDQFGGIIKYSAEVSTPNAWVAKISGEYTDTSPVFFRNCYKGEVTLSVKSCVYGSCTLINSTVEGAPASVIINREVPT